MPAKNNPSAPAGSVDPHVAELLRSAEARQAERELPAGERKKRRQSKLDTKARLKGRATYDLSPRLKERIAELARVAGVSASQFAHWWLLEAEKLYDSGKIDLYDVPSEPSESPGYDLRLKLEEDDSDPRRRRSGK